MKVVGRHDGREVIEHTLECGAQRVSVLNYGCVVRRWIFDTKTGPRDLVLGFDGFDPYPEHSKSFGIIAGRVANRTHNGRFQLNGKSYQLTQNDGRHHLHGGNIGLGKRVWQMDVHSENNSVCLTYFSPEGEEGYPGNVTFEVEYQLNRSGLVCEMRGIPDSPTPINLAQHNYYNLDGGGDIRDHSLQVDALSYLPVDNELIPTGAPDSVDGTRFDFRNIKRISEADPEKRGHDHNLVLNNSRDIAEPAAQLTSSDGLLTLSLMTDQPGIQLYTAATLSMDVAGIEGRQYQQFGGICLEAQHYPDSLNNSTFPDIICTPDNPYSQKLLLLLEESQSQT